LTVGWLTALPPLDALLRWLPATLPDLRSAQQLVELVSGFG